MREPGGGPLALLVLVVLQFIALPVLNAITRNMEAEADWVALETTEDPEATTRLWDGFAEEAKADPSPPTWSYLLFDTHPSMAKRVAMAEAWRPRERARLRNPLGRPQAGWYAGRMARSVIVSAVRTPFGKLGGALKDYEAPALGAIAIRGALDRVDVRDDEVEYVIMGQVLQGGAGQAPARQAAVGAGLPKEVPSDTINKVCASSVRAVEIADQMIRAGDHDVIVAGGMESMSNAPYILKRARFGYRLGDGAVIDLMLHDGLVSSFDGKHMVEQASFVSRELGITREEQDAWAFRSQQRAVAAIDEGRFVDELVSVNGVEVDEAPRRDTTLEKLAGLKPVFDPEGTTTAGNAPGVNDGAGALVVTSEEFARSAGSRSWRRSSASAYVADEYAYLARRPRRRPPRAREGRQDHRRRRPRRDQRGLLLGHGQLPEDARRRSREGERERRRGRARPPGRRVGRAHPRDDDLRAPPERRRARPRGDLLRRRPGRCAAPEV